MRKVILTLLFSGFGLYAIGQSAGVVNVHKALPAAELSKANPTLHGAPAAVSSTGTANWYKNREDASESGAASYTWYHNTMFSDSTVQVLYGNASGGTSLGYVFNQGYGEVFDPRAEIYDTSGTGTLSLFNTYTVDSITLPYEYNYIAEKDTDAPLSQNPDGMAHDTLIFQFYTVKTAGVDTGVYAASTSGEPPFPASPFAEVRYDYKKNLGTTTYTPTAKYIYVMGSKDSTSGGNAGGITIPVLQTNDGSNNGTVGIPVNYTVNKKQGYNRDLFAYTVSYRPGFKHKFGDTIDAQQTTPIPKNLHSQFQIIIGQDEVAGFTGLKTPIDNHEMSLQVRTATRYNNWPTGYTGFDGIYLPGTVLLEYNEILWSYFHVTTTNDAGVNSAANDPKGYILGNVYPNPASGNANLNFALGNTEQVKITLFDMLGHEIATVANGQYEAGSHAISFNTDNLKEGVYLYSINAGSFSKTLKFTVAHN